MKPRSKLTAFLVSGLLAPVALAVALAFAAPSASAEDGAGGDIKKKIQKKMEKILELMRENEAALLKLSTGASAQTKRVDVKVPEGDAGTGSGASKAGASGGTGSTGSDSGAKTTDELEKLLESVAKKGGSIPSELKQLVEMIPL